MANARLTTSVINEYIRKRTINIIRRRKLLQAMESKGLLTFNHSGLLHDFKVKFDRAPMRVFNPEGGTVTFAPTNRHKAAQIPWRSYQANDSVTKYEKLVASGEPEIIKWIGKITNELLDDMRDQFCEKLYLNGTASANAGEIWGVNTVFRQAQTIATTNVYTRRRSLPNSGSTYAGLDMSLGAYGGSWDAGSSAWPDGLGSAKYDFWTPLMVDYAQTTSGVWYSGTTGLFVNNGREVLRYALKKLSRNNEIVDLVLMDGELYRNWVASLDTAERILTQRSDANSLGVKLGWGDSINFEGSTVTWEYGMPAESTGSAYCFILGDRPMDTKEKTQGIELMSLQGQLFATDLKDFDLASVTDRYLIDFYGNLKWNPRAMAKLQSGEQKD